MIVLKKKKEVNKNNTQLKFKLVELHHLELTQVTQVHLSYFRYFLSDKPIYKNTKHFANKQTNKCIIWYVNKQTNKQTSTWVCK